MTPTMPCNETSFLAVQQTSMSRYQRRLQRKHIEIVRSGEEKEDRSERERGREENNFKKCK